MGGCTAPQIKLTLGEIPHVPVILRKLLSRVEIQWKVVKRHKEPVADCWDTLDLPTCQFLTVP